MVAEVRAFFAERLATRGRISKELRIWDYAVTYASPHGMPLPTAHTYGPDYRFYAAHGVEGVFTELEFPLTADLRDGRRAGSFEFPSIGIARDLLVGTILEAMHRIMTSPVSMAYADGVARAILRGLGLDTHAIRRLLARPGPKLRRPVRTLS